MKHHTKVYIDYFNIGQDDKPLCELCQKSVIQDIHHVNGRGKNKDVIENLIGICRNCHDAIHNHNAYTKEYLTEIHKNNLKSVKN